MPKEKAKHMPKRAPRRLSWRKVIAITFTFFVLFVIYLILSPLFPPNPMITQTSLPDELYPLAEEVFLTVDSNEAIYTDDVSFRLDASLLDTEHWACIRGTVPEYTQYEEHSRIWVNGKRVRGVAFYGTLVGLNGGGRWQFDRCFHGELESGLHLIEFHLRDSMWGEPVAIQRWAIEIE